MVLYVSYDFFGFAKPAIFACVPSTHPTMQGKF